MPRLRTGLLLLVLAAPTWAEPPDDGKRRTDLYGDPLPEGAIARCGTVRFRHGDLIQGVSFAPDGKMIASIGSDDALSVWEAATGRELHSIHGDIGDFRGVAFSSDSKLLAAGGNNLRVWDAGGFRPQDPPGL
jgi:WD40 repeat protein